MSVSVHACACAKVHQCVCAHPCIPLCVCVCARMLVHMCEPAQACVRVQEPAITPVTPAAPCKRLHLKL